MKDEYKVMVNEGP